jgi:hypothetical protein
MINEFKGIWKDAVMTLGHLSEGIEENHENPQS